jgi:hypothetical protein
MRLSISAPVRFALSPRRQLVRKFWPLAFHNRPHLIGDDLDLLNLEHAFVQLPQVRRRHDFAIDDSRRVGALIPNSRTGGTPGLER